MTCCVPRGDCGHQDATHMWDPASTDLVIRVLKDYTSIGQDDAYVGVTSHTMERKQAREYSIGGSFPKSRNIGKSWRSPKFATVCCMRGDCDTLSSSNTSLDAYYSLQRSHLASQKIYFLHPHFPSEPFPDCLGQACTHKPIAQKKNIIKNLILSLVPISLPCGIANQPKKKIALQNPHSSKRDEAGANPESSVWALSPLETTRGARETREISSQRMLCPTLDYYSSHSS